MRWALDRHNLQPLFNDNLQGSRRRFRVLLRRYETSTANSASR
jgi:hypothetical protein